MARPEMRCQTCREWMPAQVADTKVPKHYVTAPSGRAAKCAGSNKAPYEIRGFPHGGTVR